MSHEFDEAHFVARAEAGRSVLASMKPDDPGRASLERMVEAFVDHRPEAFRTKRTTVWQPMMDQPVDPAIFDTTPPTSSGRP